MNELEVLGAVADALCRDDELAVVLDRTLAIVADALELDTGWIWLLDPATARFYLAASLNLPPYLADPVRMTGEPCWCIEAFVDGDFRSKNVGVIACSRLRRAPAADATATRGLRYHASATLRFGERDLGIMNLTAPGRPPLSEPELRFLSLIGAQMGIAVERAQLAERAAALARSEERARIARDLHDTLAQELTAIALQLDRAQRRLDAPGDEAREHIATALTVTRDALEGARESVLTLRSDPLEGKPLATALAALVRQLTSESGILARFHHGDAPALPHAIEVELYRIATEALRNVRSHADAHRVDVTLDVAPADIRLRIADDGVGLPSADASEPRFGIVGMKERAQSIGGEVALRAGDNARGTIVDVRVPWVRR